jgi:capsular exopolysaccharide synthesis family protein
MHPHRSLRPGHALWSRRRVVILCAAVAMIVALGSSLVQSKRYAASARILITQPADQVEFNPQTGVRQDLSREVRVQADAVTGQDVRDRVRTLIGDDPDVTATPSATADVITVTAKAPTPADARTIADAYVRAYLDDRREAEGQRLLVALDEAVKQYDAVTQRLAAQPVAADGTPNAEQRVLILQQVQLRDQIDRAQVRSTQQAGGYSLGPASGPARPASPKPALAGLIAGFVGTVVGVGAVLTMEVLDDTIGGRDELAPWGSRLPSIAEVPFDARIAAHDDEHASGRAVEAFRSIRTALPFLTEGGDPELVLITSPNLGEGKTTVAVGLAGAMAAAGKEVCLVSCDLRRPRVERELGIEQEEGFTTVALGGDLSEALVAAPGRPRLYVLPAGPTPPNPAELLSSDVAVKIFERLRGAFDAVVVDSAPVLPVTDSALLSSRADLTVVVLASGRTTWADLDRTVSILDQAAGTAGALVVNHPGHRSWLAGTERVPSN